MAKTPSTMKELGTQAPEFKLQNTLNNEICGLDNLKSDVATVIMFICNHCPFVVHIEDELSKVSSEYMNKGVSFIAISSNDVENYPDDSPDKMKIFAERNGFKFPYLYDETQDVAKAYDAACTPDFFVYDKNLLLAYRGQLDDSRPGSEIPVSGKDLRAALDALIEGKPVIKEQKPSMGCNIKWKK